MANEEKTSKRVKKRTIFLLWVLGLSPLILLTGILFLAAKSDLPDTVALANPKTNLATQVLSGDGEV